MKKKFSIEKVKAREILDSRGNPTLEVKVFAGGKVFSAGVPSGASTGKYEAVELRDGGKRYNGKGVRKAVRNVNEIIGPEISGLDPSNQEEIDGIMKRIDGTENKSKLGANAIVGVSMAVCRAGADSKGIPLFRHISSLARGASLKIPSPSFNIINGGAHAGNDLDIQEFMIVPKAKRFSEALLMASETYHCLKGAIKKRYSESDANIGDEGGFAPSIKKTKEALDLIIESAKSAGYEKRIMIALDCAASQFFKNGKYLLEGKSFSSEALFSWYSGLSAEYPIISFEDPFEENDWDGFSIMTKKRKGKFLVIGDDLLVTNPERIRTAFEKKACSGLLLKVNQIGTVSEAIKAAKLAKSFGWKVMVSHRSGETCDDFISDLSVGIGADFIKSGAPARGERVAKYNRLLEIESEIS